MKKAYLFALALLVSCAQIEAQEYAVEELHGIMMMNYLRTLS